MRRPTACLLCLLLPALLAACAAPSSSPAAAPVAAPEAGATQDAPGAPVDGTPLRPAPAGGTVQVDRSCTTSADCAVKDVGNCCGRFPACVNKDSPTDPGAVMAQCQAKGIAGVCGYRAIEACECVAGTCQAPDQERRLRHGVRVGE